MQRTKLNLNVPAQIETFGYASTLIGGYSPRPGSAHSNSLSTTTTTTESSVHPDFWEDDFQTKPIGGPPAPIPADYPIIVRPQLHTPPQPMYYPGGSEQSTPEIVPTQQVQINEPYARVKRARKGRPRLPEDEFYGRRQLSPFFTGSQFQPPILASQQTDSASADNNSEINQAFDSVPLAEERRSPHPIGDEQTTPEKKKRKNRFPKPKFGRKKKKEKLDTPGPEVPPNDGDSLNSASTRSTRTEDKPFENVENFDLISEETAFLIGPEPTGQSKSFKPPAPTVRVDAPPEDSNWTTVADASQSQHSRSLAASTDSPRLLVSNAKRRATKASLDGTSQKSGTYSERSAIRGPATPGNTSVTCTLSRKSSHASEKIEEELISISSSIDRIFDGYTAPPNYLMLAGTLLTTFCAVLIFGNGLDFSGKSTGADNTHGRQKRSTNESFEQSQLGHVEATIFYVVFPLVIGIFAPFLGTIVYKSPKIFYSIGCLFAASLSVVYGLFIYCEVGSYYAWALVFNIIEALSVAMVLCVCHALLSDNLFLHRKHFNFATSLYLCILFVSLALSPMISEFLQQLDPAAPHWVVAGLLLLAFLLTCKEVEPTEGGAMYDNCSLIRLQCIPTLWLLWLSALAVGSTVGYYAPRLWDHLHTLGFTDGQIALHYSCFCAFLIISFLVRGAVCFTNYRFQAVTMMSGAFLCAIGMAIQALGTTDSDLPLWASLVISALISVGLACLSVSLFEQSVMVAKDNRFPETLRTFSVLGGVFISFFWLGLAFGPNFYIFAQDRLGYGWCAVVIGALDVVAGILLIVHLTQLGLQAASRNKPRRRTQGLVESTMVGNRKNHYGTIQK